MKILVVDDHVLIRQATQGVLKRLVRDAILLEAASSTEAMRIVATNPDIDLILLDLTLPDRDGFAVFTELRDRYPNISIIVLSADQHPATVRKALELGAKGYIPKSAHADVILNALRLVLAGGTYVPPEILGAGLSDTHSPKAAGDQGRILLKSAGLSDRHLDVLALIMEGKNNKTICRTLDLSEQTVKNHVSAILRALKVSSRSEAIVAVNKMGWHVAEVIKR
jgi:DNA-binding NarL/FixJ family response regulator